MSIFFTYKKNNFNFFIILIFFILNGLSAQVNWENLFVYYRNGQFEQLNKALNRATQTQRQTPEFLFFKSLFEKDGTKAMQQYQQVFNTAGGRLKKLAAKKLYEYYFARGLYLKAATFSDYLDNVTNTENNQAGAAIAPDEQQPAYWVQFGAFSTRANALKRQEVLKRHGINSVIKIRKINNRDFYCVWVKGRNTLADTDQIAKQIKKQMNFDYRIIKE